VINKGNLNLDLINHHRAPAGFAITLGRNDNVLTATLFCASVNAQQLSTKAPLPSDQWVHVALTLSRHHMRLLIDGIEVGQKRVSGYRRLNPDPFVVGSLPHGIVDFQAALSAVTSLSSQAQAQAALVEKFREQAKMRTGFDGTIRDLFFVPSEVPNLSEYVQSVKSRPDFDSSQLGSPLSAPPVEHQPNAIDFSVAPVIPPRDLNRLLAVSASAGKPSSSSDPASSVSRAIQKFIAYSSINFSPQMDSQIIQLYQTVYEKDSKASSNGDAPANPVLLSDIQPFCRSIPGYELIEKRHLQSYHSISSLPISAIRIRFQILQLINSKMSGILNLVDFSQSHSDWSLAYRIAHLSWLIFKETKLKVWQHTLRQSNTGTCSHVSLNRPRALRAMEKGDSTGLKSVFGQLFVQLHFLKPSALRTDQRAWRVTYEGEGGTDAGGLFRDSISHVCSELMSKALPLFIPCPNAKGFGDNQNVFIPNPGCTSSVQLSMFAFVGKLMGMALRGGFVLNLDFPSILWKKLVGATIDRSDVAAIDLLSIDILDKIKQISDDQGDPEAFREYVSNHFTTLNSAGVEVELKENGRSTEVNFENRLEYVELVEQFRINEFNTQLNAIRKGLGTIVPLTLLPLFTWSELEGMVCGKREINIDHLRMNTRYRAPFSPTHKSIVMFWSVMASLNHQERQLFLRFVYGQSRLPNNPADWTSKFEVWPFPNNSDHVLPVSHTCFFSLELPTYSSPDIMKAKLLYAINNCHAIDTDHAAEAINWDAD